MGDRHRCPTLRNLRQGFLNRGFRFVVHRRCGFIENQNRRVFEDGAGDYLRYTT
jgi:hypothetical protein